MNWTTRRPPNKKPRPITPTRILIYTRLQSVNKDHPNLVAQQDLDTAEANDLTAAAAIAAAKADVEKYQTHGQLHANHRAV